MLGQKKVIPCADIHRTMHREMLPFGYNYMLVEHTYFYNEIVLGNMCAAVMAC